MPAKEKRRSTGADDGRVVLNLTKSMTTQCIDLISQNYFLYNAVQCAICVCRLYIFSHHKTLYLNAVFKRSSATSSAVFKTHSLLGGSPVYRVSRDFRASNLDIAIANIGPKIWQNHLLW